MQSEGLDQDRISRAIEDLAADYERCGGALKRSQVDRLYFKRKLTPDECAAVEDALSKRAIKVEEPELQRAEPDETAQSPASVDSSGPRDALTQLLNDARKHPLLTENQERELGRAIQLAHRVSAQSEAEDHDLGRSYVSKVQERGLAAKRMLVASNIRLVAMNARAFPNLLSLERADLVQEGLIGLMTAAEKYDPEKGFRFSTYATWWIRQAMHRARDDKDATIRIPVHLMGRIRKYRSTARRLRGENGGREPTPTAIARALGWDEEKAEKISWRIEELTELQKLMDLDKPLSDEEGAATLLDLIPSDDPGQEEAIAARELSRLMERYLLQLGNPRSIEVIRGRFGFDGEELTLEQLGRRFGITRERIRQIERNAMKRLSKIIPKRELRSLLLRGGQGRR